MASSSTHQMSGAVMEAASQALVTHCAAYDAAASNSTCGLMVLSSPTYGSITVHRNYDALAKTYAEKFTTLGIDANSDDGKAALARMADESINEVQRIIHQCNLHTNLVTKKLVMHEQLQELEMAKLFIGNTKDRGVAREGPSPASSLPSDTWCVITEFLPMQDVVNLPLVSRQLFDDRDVVTWNTTFERFFGVTGVPLSEEQTWHEELRSRVSPMLSIMGTKKQGHSGLPGVSRFLDEVAPKGSYRFGNKNLLITRTDPIRMMHAQRHGAQQALLQADTVSTSRGPMTVISYTYDEAGFRFGLLGQEGTVLDHKALASVRQAVAKAELNFASAAAAASGSE